MIIKHVECGLYHDKHQKTHQLFVVLDIGQTVTQLVHKEYQIPKIHLFWPPVCGYHVYSIIFLTSFPYVHCTHIISSSFVHYVIGSPLFIHFG